MIITTKTAKFFARSAKMNRVNDLPWAPPWDREEDNFWRAV